MHILAVQITEEWNPLIKKSFEEIECCGFQNINMDDVRKTLIKPKNKCDAIIIDISTMESFHSGWQVLKFLQRYKKLVKIALTAYELKDLRETFELDGYFIKDPNHFDIDELNSIVSVIYDQRNPKPPTGNISIDTMIVDKLEQMATTITN